MKIRQVSPKIDPYIKKYGCYFMSILNSVGKEFTAEEVNALWASCIKKGFITGDLNNDGDLDDAEEAIIKDPNGVCKECGTNYTFVDRHFPPTVDIPNNYYVIGCYFNPKNKFTHFVVIDKDKKVTYDPIPNSLTVRFGYLKSMRLFKPV